MAIQAVYSCPICEELYYNASVAASCCGGDHSIKIEGHICLKCFAFHETSNEALNCHGSNKEKVIQYCPNTIDMFGFKEGNYAN